MRIHTYVVAIDAGSAPNYDAPFVTLTVCKPRIRKKAVPGDCVLAFAGARVNPSDPHSVVWAGIVREVIPLAEYWSDRRFARKRPGRTSRPDNFYRPARGGFIQVPNPVHGENSIVRDTSGVNALVFDPAWRFGAYGPRLPAEFGLRMVGGRRGERVRELSATEWKRLQAWLDAQPVGVSQETSKQGICAPRKRTTRPKRF